jgi:lipopolysaccharide transport protein LptA
MKAFIDSEHFMIRKNVFSKKKIKNSDWMYVNAMKGEFFTSQNRAIYQGNVKSRMPDLTILGQKLEIKFNEKEGDSFFVQDKVQMYHKNRHAKAERAFIEMSSNKILLEGNASVDSKGNIISGKKITLYMDEDKIDVEDAEGRIQNEADSK